MRAFLRCPLPETASGPARSVARARALTATTVRPRSAAMSKTDTLEMTSSRSRSSSSEVQVFTLFSFFASVLRGKKERRGVRSIFQPTLGFKGGLERSARTRFRGCRFGSVSQSLVSQLPVRLVTINRGQGEHKGRRRVSIGNTLTAEVSLDFEEEIESLTVLSRSRTEPPSQV